MMRNMNKAQSKAGDLIETRKAQFSVGLPGHQFRRFDKLAKRAGCSRSEFAAEILTRHMDREAKAA
jgi:metal-responsive CopG/Arc/MetJ family transcriptional regulator